ncbi:MAG: SH3 domain-containing protein [Alphaproteobacteria bacterium]|nr:MAG: SH3 domain-containing protein [Alphaproteobacteria bacterium]
MQTHEIVMGIPQIRMDHTEFKLDIPEFAMRTQQLKFDVPQITVKSIRVEAAELKEDAEEKAAEMQAEITATKETLFGTARERIAGSASTYFTCMRTQIQMKRDRHDPPGAEQARGYQGRHRSRGDAQPPRRPDRQARRRHGAVRRRGPAHRRTGKNGRRGIAPQPARRRLTSRPALPARGAGRPTRKENGIMRYTVTAHGLFLRKDPRKEAGNERAVLPEGCDVELHERSGKWCRVSGTLDGVAFEGWVSGAYLAPATSVSFASAERA